jgi:hypothetical protein
LTALGGAANWHKGGGQVDSLLHVLQALERELHHPGVRCSRSRLEQLLHPDFCEVGRSGRWYDRTTIIRFLAEQPRPPAVESDGFAASLLSPGVALLTYRSAHRGDDGMLASHTLRSSVWLRVGDSWQVRYHQGTPAAQPW